MEEPHHVAAVVLAAGESRRFGSPKQVAELEGRSLLEHVLERAEAAGLAPVVAVVPVWLTRPRRLDPDAVRWVRNPYPERGISHSLRLGFAALADDEEAAVILLGDQPRMPAERIRAVVAARGERPLVATREGDHLAPPVLVERSHFAILAEPSGDIGLRRVLAEHPDWVLAVEATEPVADVDTPADLERLRDG